MKGSKGASRRTLKSDLAKIDAHVVQPAEYEELPELDDAMLARSVVNRPGVPGNAPCVPKRRSPTRGER